MEPTDATLWDFVLTPEGAADPIDAATADALASGDQADVPDGWQVQPGGVLLVTAVVLWAEGVPRWVERMTTRALQVGPEAVDAGVELGRQEARAVARAILERAGVPPAEEGIEGLRRGVWGSVRTGLRDRAVGRGRSVQDELEELVGDIRAEPERFLRFDLVRGVWEGRGAAGPRG